VAGRATTTLRRGGSLLMHQPDRPRVVLVDDNDHLRATIGELLIDAGIQVVAEAADGIQALRTIPPLAAAAPLVVLMDLRMPGPVNGIEATRLLVERCHDVRVIVFTAFLGAGIEQAARTAGAVDLLVKGCPAATITASIRGAWAGTVRRAG
jgi:DNA-binding NarL/FixJ family response regulator